MNSMITEAALAMSRSVELSILVKATLVLVMGLAATQLAGRMRASRHHLLLAASSSRCLHCRSSLLLRRE